MKHGVAKPKFDDRLLRAANSTVGFLSHMLRLSQNAPNTPIAVALKQHYASGGHDLFNPGIALALAYIYFVYSRELLADMSLEGLNLSAFTCEPSVAPEALLRHIRNAISHGRVSVSDRGSFAFEDVSPRTGSRVFFGVIEYAAFGEFVDAFGKRAVEYVLAGRSVH